MMHQTKVTDLLNPNKFKNCELKQWNLKTKPWNLQTKPTLDQSSMANMNDNLH